MPFSSPQTRVAARAGVLAAVATLALGAAAGACAHNPQPGEPGFNPSDTVRTTVRVQNQSFLDVNVYVLRSSTRVRLGTVTGNSTSVLTIPRSLITIVTPVRFISVPIGGNRAPISDEVTVSPGDEVGILIPPG